MGVLLLEEEYGQIKTETGLDLCIVLRPETRSNTEEDARRAGFGNLGCADRQRRPSWRESKLEEHSLNKLKTLSAVKETEKDSEKLRKLFIKATAIY